MIDIRPSGIRAVFDRARALERAGRRIIHLEIGRPHFDSPQVAKEAAAQALRDGVIHYTPSRGVPELVEAIAERFDRDREEVVVTSGGSEAVMAAVAALLGPGDEAIVLDPAWPHYDGHIRLVGATPIHVPCEPPAFRPDPERLAAAMTRRTRALVVASPSNPTGTVLPPEDLVAIAGLCRAHDLWALSDEIYAPFVYGETNYRTIVAENGMRERTIIIDSASKRWSMTGWRVGWALAPPSVAAKVNAVHQHIGVCAPAFAQVGVLAALRDGAEHTEAMRAAYEARRDELLARAGQLGFLPMAEPGGAFYAFPRMTILPGARPALELLEQAGVAVVPGEVFGGGYEDHLRISYAVDRDELTEGLDRIREWSSGRTSPGGA